MTSSPAEVLTRLSAVDDASDHATRKAHGGSRARLMMEYLRRTAAWVQHYAWTETWIAFDLAEVVDPDYRAPEPAETALADLLGKVGSTGAVANTYRGMVRLAAMRTDPDVTLPDLPDPYEPLLAMYERGGGFVTEHGGVDTGTRVIPRKPPEFYLSRPALDGLGAAELDALDAAEM